MTARDRGKSPAPPKGASAPGMPLTEASVGQKVILVAVAGGAGLRHRLAEMGLMPGARFRILNRGQPGPVLVLLGDTRLMLGRGMVHRIRVRPAGP